MDRCDRGRLRRWRHVLVLNIFGGGGLVLGIGLRCFKGWRKDRIGSGKRLQQLGRGRRDGIPIQRRRDQILFAGCRQRRFVRNVVLALGLRLIFRVG